MPATADARMFKGERVRLRAYDPRDGEAFRRWVRDDTDSGRMNYEIPFPRSGALAGGGELPPPQDDNFGFMVETLDGMLVGGVDAHDCNPRSGIFMLGIGIFPEARGKGYATEAVRLLLAYYFCEKRYRKCHSVVFSFNPPSIRLHERVGFTREARLRRMVYSEGAYHDELHYGMTIEEFNARYHLPEA